MGVTWRPSQRKWECRIQREGKPRGLGSFHSEEVAARAFDAAARRLRGKGAHGGKMTSGPRWVLNFPTDTERRRKDEQEVHNKKEESEEEEQENASEVSDDENSEDERPGRETKLHGRFVDLSAGGMLQLYCNSKGVFYTDSCSLPRRRRYLTEPQWVVDEDGQRLGKGPQAALLRGESDSGDSSSGSESGDDQSEAEELAAPSRNDRGVYGLGASNNGDGEKGKAVCPGASWDAAQDAELARLVAKMGPAFDQIAPRLTVPRTTDGARYRWYTALGPAGQVTALQQAYLRLYNKPPAGPAASQREWLRGKIAQKDQESEESSGESSGAETSRTVAGKKKESNKATAKSPAAAAARAALPSHISAGTSGGGRHEEELDEAAARAKAAEEAARWRRFGCCGQTLCWCQGAPRARVPPRRSRARRTTGAQQVYQFGAMWAELGLDVASILARREGSTGTEYRVLWKGYPLDEATWEPKSNLDCDRLIEQFEASNGDTVAAETQPPSAKRHKPTSARSRPRRNSVQPSRFAEVSHLIPTSFNYRELAKQQEHQEAAAEAAAEAADLAQAHSQEMHGAAVAATRR
eukprot:COSAG04_NODE_852_length_9862_cov_6.945229_4_plen_581_part_00